MGGDVRWGISPLGEALSLGVGPKPMEMELLFGVLGFNGGNFCQSPFWRSVVISQIYNTHVPSLKLSLSSSSNKAWSKSWRNDHEGPVNGPIRSLLMTLHFIEGPGYVPKPLVP